MGNSQLFEIRGEHIQKLYNELTEEGYALSSIKIVIGSIERMFSTSFKKWIDRQKSGETSRTSTADGKKNKESNDKRTAGTIYETCKRKLFVQFFCCDVENWNEKRRNERAEIY